MSEPRPRGFDLPALGAGLVALVCILLSVTTRIDDPDVWQHLAVGKAIAELHRVPSTHLWTWVGYGKEEVLPSWSFRVLLWGFWEAGGLVGLYAWRWLTTAAAFALLWAAARRMGARGLATFWILVLAALSYRARSQLRPETWVAVLLALQVFLHESARAGGRARGLLDPRLAGIVLVACAWANAHISYWLGLFIQIAYLAECMLGARIRRDSANTGPSAGALAATLAASIAISFVNPFGAAALWQPFEFFLVWRHEPVYRTIIELHPLMWHAHWKSGLPLVVLGWPILMIARARHRGLDLAEAILCLGTTALALFSQRFTGLYVLIAAPFMARDLAGVLEGERLPQFLAPRGVRAAIVAVACVGTGLLEWSRPEVPIGIGVDLSQYPVRACDFMEAEDISGRGFTPYYLAGYQIWRFWPRQDRLPFMDIHQSGTRRDRELYAYSFASEAAWHELEALHRFDYAMLDGHAESVRGDRLLDFLDADTSWALVFRDDAAAVYARRGPRFAALIERRGFTRVPGGDAAVPLLLRAAQRDSAAGVAARAELERQVAASPDHTRALSLLATLDWMQGRPGEARRHLEEALRVDPRSAGTHLRLGLIALSEARPADAVRAFEAERRLGYGLAGIDYLLGQAYARSGRFFQARKAYERELRVEPGNQAARDSLAALPPGS